MTTVAIKYNRKYTRFLLLGGEARVVDFVARPTMTHQRRGFKHIQKLGGRALHRRPLLFKSLSLLERSLSVHGALRLLFHFETPIERGFGVVAIAKEFPHRMVHVAFLQLHDKLAAQWMRAVERGVHRRGGCCWFVRRARRRCACACPAILHNQKMPKRKRAAVTTTSAKKVKLAAPAPAGDSDADVVIISSKACQAFAKRHDELQKLIKEKDPKLKVDIQVEKKLSSNPDRGNFVVSAKGKTIVDLKAIPRPFSAMKLLDMNDVASRVVSEFS